MMQKVTQWMYTVDYLDKGTVLQGFLNQRGRQGWELVNVLGSTRNGWVLFFKAPWNPVPERD